MTLSALRCPKCCECRAAQPISTASRGRMGFPRRSKRLGDSVDLLDFYLRSSLRVVLGWVENVENSKRFFLLKIFGKWFDIYIYIYLYLYYIGLYIYLYLYIVFWFIKTLGCSSTCPIMGQIWLAFRTTKTFLEQHVGHCHSEWGELHNSRDFMTTRNKHTYTQICVHICSTTKSKKHTYTYVYIIIYTFSWNGKLKGRFKHKLEVAK